MAEQAKARATTDARRQRSRPSISAGTTASTTGTVDLGAWEVLGRSLVDRPRDVLDELAGSDDPWRRRSAITATFAFIRRGELDDTFRIAVRLLNDPHDLVNKAVGWALRNAGDHDSARLLAFPRHGSTMPRDARNAIEKLPPPERRRLSRWIVLTAAGCPVGQVVNTGSGSAAGAVAASVPAVRRRETRSRNGAN
jgi:hypothetical protein